MISYIHIPSQTLSPVDSSGQREVECEVVLLDQARRLSMWQHHEAICHLGAFAPLRSGLSRRRIPEYLEQVLAQSERANAPFLVKIDPVVYNHLREAHPALFNKLIAQGRVGVSDDLYVISVREQDVTIEYIGKGTTVHDSVLVPVLGVYRAVTWSRGNPFRNLQTGTPELELARSVVRDYLDARWAFHDLPPRLVWCPTTKVFRIPWSGMEATLGEEFGGQWPTLPTRLVFVRPHTEPESIDVSVGTTVPLAVVRRAIEVIRGARQDDRLETRPVPQD